jgi:hypothetical protein
MIYKKIEVGDLVDWDGDIVTVVKLYKFWVAVDDARGNRYVVLKAKVKIAT